MHMSMDDYPTMMSDDELEREHKQFDEDVEEQQQKQRQQQQQNNENEAMQKEEQERKTDAAFQQLFGFKRRRFQ